MSDCSAQRAGPVMRLLIWAGALASAATAVAVTWWGMSGLHPSASADRLDAAVLPDRLLAGLAAHFRDLELFGSFDVQVPWSLLVGAVWLWSLVGCGALAARPALRDATALEALVFSFATGYVLLSLATLLLGLLHLSSPLPLLMLLAGAAVTATFQGKVVAGWLRDVAPVRRRPFRRYAGHNLLILLLLLAGGATLLTALTPPIQSDALRYHLGAPQEFLKAGRISYLPWNAFSNFPFLADMHFMIALAVRAPAASQIMHFLTAGATAMAVAGFVQRFILPVFKPGEEHRLEESSSAGRGLPRSIALPLLAATAYFTLPAGLILASWPFVDHAVALFFLLSLYALLLALEKSSAGTWALFGLMAGGAMGTKYTALPHVALLAAVAAVEWVVFSPPPSTGSRRTLRPRHLLLAAVLTAVVGGTWFAKNLVLTGNPVYPLANKVFRGGDWTEESAALYMRKAGEKGAPRTLPDLITSPAAATFSWKSYETHFLGPWLLVALLAGLVGSAAAVAFCRRRARPLLWTAVIAGAYYGTWFFSYQSNRMLVPFLALFLPVAATLPAAAGLVSGWCRSVATASFVICMVYGAAWAVQWQYVRSPYPSQIRYVLGDMSRSEYLQRALPHYRAFQELARRMKPGEKALFVGEHRIMYAPFEAVWSDWFDTPAVLGILRESGAGSGDELLAELRRRGIRWIFYNEHELGLGRPPQLELYFRPRFRHREWQTLQELLSHPALERQNVSADMTLLRIPEVPGGGS